MPVRGNKACIGFAMICQIFTESFMFMHCAR
eukprot:COSAG05_NODE_6170_length_1008_cov_1.484615_1_plen_30_part_10